MKIIRYDDIDTGYEQFQVDHHTKEAYRYHEPISSVRVYETGQVKIYGNGDRDPYWRAKVRKECGMDFRLLSDVQGIVITTVDGKKVPKNALDDGVYLLNHEYGIMLATNWGRLSARIVYPAPGAMPYSHSDVMVTVRRKDKEKEILTKYKDTLDLALTVASLTTDRKLHRLNRSVHDWVKGALNGNDLTKVGDDNHRQATQVALGLYQKGGLFGQTFNDILRLECNDHVPHKYLLFKQG